MEKGESYMRLQRSWLRALELLQKRKEMQRRARLTDKERIPFVALFFEKPGIAGEQGFQTQICQRLPLRLNSSEPSVPFAG